MKWSLREPRYGDMIRVKVRDLYHYGIYASDEEIIEFGPPPTSVIRKDDEIEVCVTDWQGFLAGGFMECADLSIKERFDRKKPDDTVAAARARIGERGYNILHNNCEHFANECMFGKKESSQEDSVRSFFRNMPIADVYVAPIPYRTGEGNIKPASRQVQIEDVANPDVKESMISDWNLLTYAIDRSLGLTQEKANFRRDGNGIWVSDKCYVSLTHCKGAVAVCVSKAPCGIDMEPQDRDINVSIERRILTDKERNAFEELTDEESRQAFLKKIWTRKESIFKSTYTASFRPEETESDADTCVTNTVETGGQKYMLSVNTTTPKKLRYYFPAEGKVIE
ncbi:MAG: lecithin retinol acyltransferase family protein [Clostridiales bacterium]|nr:lecithin retinol acyltransferase family protein [Clostridiales bacterium]